MLGLWKKGAKVCAIPKLLEFAAPPWNTRNISKLPQKKAGGRA
jgi:hypothetical protein